MVDDPTLPAPDEMCVITQDASAGYRQDLHLARDGHDTVWATWCLRCRDGAKVQWRRIEDGTPSAIRSVHDHPGRPCAPVILPQTGRAPQLVWTEYTASKGTVFALDTTDAQTTPQRVFNAVLNLGEFSCDRNTSGDAWLVAEVWSNRRVGLRLARWCDGRWQDRGDVAIGATFVARPRIQAGTRSGFLLSWDEYGPGGYRVATARVDDDGVSPSAYAPDGPGWQTMSSAAPSGQGGWYLAYGTDQWVELDGGAAGHHSEIRVAKLDATSPSWALVDTVDIDYAMNPWMAAYVGRRRQPCLVSGTDAVWLLWEMKEDPASMGPGPGQLWATPVDQGPTGGQARLLLDNRSWFVPARSPVAQPDVLVATKTQYRAFDAHLDYVLHRVRPAAVQPQPAPPTVPCAAHRLPAVARPGSRAETDGYRLWFGDPHLHSWVSGDLEGEPDEVYHVARDVAQLDFAALTDNDHTRFTEPLSGDAWERLKRLANHFNDPNRFTAFVGWEYTKCAHPARSGDITSHRCVLFPGDDGPVHSCHDDCDTPQQLIVAMRGTRCLLHHHHGEPLDLTDDALERNVEICCGWGHWMRRDDYQARLHDLLRSGRVFGFFGASDNHERNPGLGGALTGAWATANTREGVYEAFEQRRVFATTGLRPVLVFRVCGTFMGGTVTTDADPELSVHVVCERPVERVDIVRDGETVHTLPGGTGRFDDVWTDTACPDGAHFYYAHVTFQGDETVLPWNVAPAVGVHAWSSPVWVTRG